MSAAVQNGQGQKQDSNSAFRRLLGRITARSAVVGVIGLGYVGLPLAHLLHSSGLAVVGYDTDEDKITKLSRGESYIHHIPPAVASKLSESARFKPTSKHAALSQCDVIIMCLPTPVGPHNEPDMSFVLSTTRQLCQGLKAKKENDKNHIAATATDAGGVGATLIILESTTYPGATDSDITTVLGEAGLILGTDVFLAFSPEREDPGNASFATCDIPKLVGGVDSASTDLAATLYETGGFTTPVRVSSARVAECAKLLENTYRAVNIALVNEMKQVFASMGVNVWEVLDAASTKPFGFHRFNPGPGIGGHCIPVDPFYLTWKAKETGAPCSFIELAATVNAQMPQVVVHAVQKALNDQQKPVNGSTILLLGIAYKPNVDDIREAPALVIWERLLDMGAHVKYCDPFVKTVCQTRKHMRLSQQQSVELDDVAKCCVQVAGQMQNATDLDRVQVHDGQSVDAVLLVTHHDCFEGYGFLKGFKGPVIDTRNRIPKTMGLNIVLA